MGKIHAEVNVFVKQWKACFIVLGSQQRHGGEYCGFQQQEISTSERM